MFVMFTSADNSCTACVGTKIVVNAYSVTGCLKEKSTISSATFTALYIENREQPFIIQEEPEEVHAALMECIAVPTVTCPPPPM